MRELSRLAAISAFMVVASQAQASEDRLHQIEHLFEGATVLKGPSVVDCTLSGGAQTSCFSITVKAEPQTYTPGPWCPRNVLDGDDAGGIWLEGGEVNQVDGAFIANMAAFYGDATWQLYDPATGAISVTDTEEECRLAAQPNVPDSMKNHCVECQLSIMPEDAAITYVIPLEPQAATTPVTRTRSGFGVALNGVKLDAPAPVDAILGGYTIAPFDDCGGHVNPHSGYHYHAVTDCLPGEAKDSEDARLIGIALDGFAIYSQTDEALDQCGGHSSEELGYHYHAGPAGGNAILGCLTAQMGCALDDADATCDASVTRRGPPPRD